MPLKVVQLGPNLFYGDTAPEGPNEGAEWRQANGSAQFFVGGKWRSAPLGVVSGNGSGGAVTQQTNRTTGVTLNALAGTITTNNASLAAEAAAKFTVTNNQVNIADVVVVSQQSGSNGGNTDVVVVAVTNGTFDVLVANNNASGGTAETGAILINFVVVKGAVT